MGCKLEQQVFRQRIAADGLFPVGICPQFNWTVTLVENFAFCREFNRNPLDTLVFFLADPATIQYSVLWRSFMSSNRLLVFV